MDIQTYLNRPIPRSDDRGLGNPVPDAAECGEAIVDITNANPRIAYAASYAARGVQGGLTHCYVRAGVYERLKAVLDLLPEEYSFLIYDTLRPLRVQEALFEEYIEVLKKEHPQANREELEEICDEFVAKPSKNQLRPSSHQSGGAVDLTLCRDGAPLDMGTAFDEFAPIAYADAFEKPGMDETVRQNRRLLHNVMCDVGFTFYESEWWHFNYGNESWARRNFCAPIYSFCADAPDLI